MPQARSGSSGGGSRSSRSSSSGSGSTSRSKSSRSSSSGSRSRSSGTRSRSSASSTSARARSAAGSAEANADAVAQRLRKLNERIIKAGQEAGEATLSSYERALKAIASTIERGPGSSEVDWISNLATAQAKFIRDVTNAWTSAARQRLK
jgi:hypothetical protein